VARGAPGAIPPGPRPWDGAQARAGLVTPDGVVLSLAGWRGPAARAPLVGRRCSGAGTASRHHESARPLVPMSRPLGPVTRGGHPHDRTSRPHDRGRALKRISTRPNGGYRSRHDPGPPIPAVCRSHCRRSPGRPRAGQRPHRTAPGNRRPHRRAAAIGGTRARWSSRREAQARSRCSGDRPLRSRSPPPRQGSGRRPPPERGRRARRTRCPDPVRRWTQVGQADRYPPPSRHQDRSLRYRCRWTPAGDSPGTAGAPPVPWRWSWCSPRWPRSS